MTPTYAQFLADEGVKLRLIRQAHRERAEALGRALALLRLFRHAPRPHLA